MTSNLEPAISQFVNDEWVKLNQNQITPWAFMSVGHPFRCKNFHGKVISYQGVKFEGSPRKVFWSGYIEPFLKDIIRRTVDFSINLASEKGQGLSDVLSDTSNLLKQLTRNTYERMAEIDQNLRGEGFPKRVALRSTEHKETNIGTFIDEVIQAELAMDKPKSQPNTLKEKAIVFYQENQLLLWFIGLLVSSLSIIIPLLL